MTRLSTLKRRQNSVKSSGTFRKQNTISNAIVVSTDNHVYLFRDRPRYHQDTCFWTIFYVDDCCCKWMCDLLFQILFLPLRIFGFLCKGLFSICCEEKNICQRFFECIQEGCYYPFRLFGEWINQCYFSCGNFCC